MRINQLAALVVVGALLDVGVFTFQLIDNGRISQNSTNEACWTQVLDHLVTDTHGLTRPPTPATRHQLTAQARQCAQESP